MESQKNTIPDDKQDRIDLIDEFLDLMNKWDKYGLYGYDTMRLCLHAVAAFIRSRYNTILEAEFMREASKAFKIHKKIGSLEIWENEEENK